VSVCKWTITIKYKTGFQYFAPLYSQI
jgi:hypothetical protein